MENSKSMLHSIQRKLSKPPLNKLVFDMYDKMNLNFGTRICIFALVTQLFYPNYCACAYVSTTIYGCQNSFFSHNYRDFDRKVQPRKFER
jgi:hypothetical protein